jgi:hypothetical protein
MGDKQGRRASTSGLVAEAIGPTSSLQAGTLNPTPHQPTSEPSSSASAQLYSKDNNVTRILCITILGVIINIRERLSVDA